MRKVLNLEEKSMSKLITSIGVIVLTFIMVLVPYLMAVSIMEEWDGFIETVLIVATIVDGLAISNFIYGRIEKPTKGD